MGSMRRFLFRLRRLGERRRTGARVPVEVRARFDLDGIVISGTARDIGLGGVFFETPVPLAPGVRGELAREGGHAPVTVRVSWTRRASGAAPAGLGLEFESNRRR